VLERHPTEVPRHAALLGLAERYPAAAAFAMVLCDEDDARHSKLQAHRVASLPAAVVYADGTHVETAHGMFRRIEARLDRALVGRPAPGSATLRQQVAAAGWRGLSGLATWGSWGTAAARKNGPVAVLLGMFVVATLALQLDATLRWITPRHRPDPGPADGRVADAEVVNAGAGADELHRTHRRLLAGLRRFVPSIVASSVPAHLTPRGIGRFIEAQGGTHETSVLVMHLRRGRVAPTASGEVSVTDGDLVFALAARRLSQMRHVYYFGWLDVDDTATAEWLARLPPALHEAATIDVGGPGPAFTALVMTASHAAPYIAPVGTVFTNDEGGEPVNVVMARQHRAHLVTFLDRLADGSERWLRLGDITAPKNIRA